MTASAYGDRRWLASAEAGDLSPAAWLFFRVTVAAAIAVAAATSLASTADTRWRDFGIVLGLGALAQLFATRTPGHHVFHAGLAFTVAAALVLPPELVVAVAVGQHLPEWLRLRYRWYIQTFNIANAVLSGLTAWVVAAGVGGAGWRIDALPAAWSVLAAACATGAFIVVNHLLLAVMMRLARDRGLAAADRFTADGLAASLALGGAGVTIALALLWEPALAIVAVLPLVAIQRAFVLPALREQAFRDHRTGLLNSRGIEHAAVAELARARRLGRPMSVLLCDVDDLRGINNRHGHLGGDAALVAVAEALRAGVRSIDLCARLGGDEFVVLLRETAETEAWAVARRVRERLARNPLVTGTGLVPIGVSIGVASLAGSDRRLEDLVARADAAMYASKPRGAAIPGANQAVRA